MLMKAISVVNHSPAWTSRICGEGSDDAIVISAAFSNAACFASIHQPTSTELRDA